jgi:peptidyl-prolyl cis-trans isomerase B (cyclophilin B)
VAGKKERQRRLARERYQRQQARRAVQAQRWRKWTIIGLVTCAVIGLGVGGYFLLAGGGKSASAASASPKASATAAATASATPSATASAAAPVEPATHCSYPASPPAARNVGVPPAAPDSKATYRATIVTNRGNVVIDLLNAKATCTVNSFVYLAGKSYFSSTHCHRLTTSSIYVLQCGDPAGTGTGGPGYKFGSENLAGATYPQGTIAMAHPGGPAGDTENGSQFFIVYRNTSLPADYTPFGTVVKGLGIIQNVAKAGTDNANGPGDGHPRQKVVIERVTITKT